MRRLGSDWEGGTLPVEALTQPQPSGLRRCLQREKGVGSPTPAHVCTHTHSPRGLPGVYVVMWRAFSLGSHVSDLFSQQRTCLKIL